MKKILFVLLVIFTGKIVIAQDTTAKKSTAVATFERIAKAAASYKLNTSTPPDDKITKKIMELRELRGGFNINEAIAFKIEEDRQKKEVSEEGSNKLADYFTSGQGKTMLDNAVIWIYRDHFNYAELKQMVKFYKTSAGQKFADNLPVILLQSAAAAEMIKEKLLKN